MSLRVLVADDQPLVRAGFEMILDAVPTMEMVGTAADGREAVEKARALRPDVVLMDIRMPIMDGLEATRLLAGPDVADPLKVIILTTFDMDEYVYEALRSGASGFLLKDVMPDRLVEAVEVVASGDALLAPSVTRRLLHRFVQPEPEDATRTAALESLTEREREVLALLGRGRSNAEIAQALVVSEATVKTHVSHVLTKLGLRDRIQAVVLAYEAGVVRPGSGGSDLI